MQMTPARRRRGVRPALFAAIGLVCAAAAGPALALKPQGPATTLVGGLITRTHGTLAPGTRVRSSDVLKRVFIDSRHGVALASVGQAQYAVATADGGRSWRTSSPALHLNAAQAPLAVEEAGMLSSRVWYAAGGGEVVDATPDAGRHWYRALFQGGVLGVIPSGGRLLAVVAAPAGSSTWIYASADGGRTWSYEPGL